MTDDPVRVLRERWQDALAAAKEVHPGDPASQEAYLLSQGWGSIARAYAEGRREERHRIRRCWRLREVVAGRDRDFVAERALSPDRPTAEELARELVGRSGAIQ